MARVPRCLGAAGSVPLLAGPQSGPDHAPQSPKTPHLPSAPEPRPVKGDYLRWFLSFQPRACPLQRRKESSWPGEDGGLPRWVGPNYWRPVTPVHNSPRWSSLEHQRCPGHLEEILVEEILNQTLHKKDNKRVWKSKTSVQIQSLKTMTIAKTKHDIYEIRNLKTTYLMNLRN